MNASMSASELAADALVRAYLQGRRMPETMHDAVVWVVERRLTSGKRPVLDAALRADIDSQAVAPPWPETGASPARSGAARGSSMVEGA